MKLILTLVFLLAFVPAALAAGNKTPLPDIAALESYLNSISTLQARFTQTAGDGQQLSGTFMLKRPGKLRFEYDPPAADLIVADGTFIHYYDGQMKQESSAPISQSLADFFLRPDLQLSGDIGVSGIERKDGLLEMTLIQSRQPLAGYLTLVFSENPLQLKKWVIIDAEGLTTTVELTDAQFGIDLNDKLFFYYDPSHKKSFINK